VHIGGGEVALEWFIGWVVAEDINSPPEKKIKTISHSTRAENTYPLIAGKGPAMKK
jgi:hypothetical protein